MADEITIRNALGALDPSNDDDWTTSGLPSMDAVRTLAGPEATRAQVQRAAPDFCRSNPVLPEPSAPIRIGNDWAAKSPSERAAQAASIAEASQPDGGSGESPSLPEASSAEALRQKVADLDEQHRAITASIRAAKVEQARIDAERDAAQRELDKLSPPETFSQQYRRVMEQSIKDRAARAEALRNAPPRPVEVKSPLDLAYAARGRRM